MWREQLCRGGQENWIAGLRLSVFNLANDKAYQMADWATEKIHPLMKRQVVISYFKTQLVTVCFLTGRDWRIRHSGLDDQVSCQLWKKNGYFVCYEAERSGINGGGGKLKVCGVQGKVMIEHILVRNGSVADTYSKDTVSLQREQGSRRVVVVPVGFYLVDGHQNRHLLLGFNM